MRPRTPGGLATRPTARSSSLALLRRRRRGLLGLLDDLRDRGAGLGAHLQPVVEPVLLQRDLRGAEIGIVGADLLVEAAVAGIPRVGRDHVVERRFLRAPAGEA